jgi:hypothetical protein
MKMTQPEEQTGRYQVQRVVLKEKREPDNWYAKTKGEWRVVDTRTNTVIKRFKWTITEDNTEWPERTFYTGPKKVVIADNGREVHCYHTMESIYGFKFEGQDEPIKVDVFPLPDE